MPSNHFDAAGNAHMVDVSAKQITRRTATASSRISMNAEAATLVRSGQGRKGDVLSVARLAAIGAAKWTSHLIPLCHAIPIESVSVDFHWHPQTPAGQSNSARQLETDRTAADTLVCSVTCVTSGKTGIEMEAMTGASLAALTVYDMLKSVDRAMVIGPTRLEQKDGGVSGQFDRNRLDQAP